MLPDMTSIDHPSIETTQGTWPCQADCRHAATLASHPDWLRCQRPDATRLVVPRGEECAHFDALPPAPAPARD